MFLEHKPSGKLVEISSISELYDPCIDKVTGRFHAGEEMQDMESFTKSHLIFPSGESLPKCWLDAHYRDRAPSKPEMQEV